MKIFLGVFLFAVIVAVNASGDDDDFKCIPGVKYQENNCNGCHCSNDQLLGCTRMGCLNQDPKLYNCEKGTTWKEGCEQCWCIDMGTLCTTGCGKVHDQHQ
ncbi:hypothetical protein ILUMI_04304 [Ignelater luminosus]|uniref:Protease inhibitor n=1 Tax=Ignelater luminosus TaxID=2038154 RepID=A0A8K0D977_IGNLU|nr:hypothetical protein ILUMI_04304 [Ignelater luminosus]